MEQAYDREKLGIEPCDFLFPAVACLVALAVFLATHLTAQPDTRQVEISVDGTVTQTLPLEEDASLLIESAGGTNQLIISQGEAWIESATCDTQVCVHHRAISRVGESIICAPNRVVVAIIGPDETDEGPDLEVG